MKLNAIETHETICGWIASANKEVQLNVLTIFITETFAGRFTRESNVLHGQCIDNMLAKIEARRYAIGICENIGLESIHQMD